MMLGKQNKSVSCTSILQPSNSIKSIQCQSSSNNAFCISKYSINGFVLSICLHWGSSFMAFLVGMYATYVYVYIYTYIGLSLSPALVTTQGCYIFTEESLEPWRPFFYPCYWEGGKLNTGVYETKIYTYMDVSENNGTPKSSILIGFSIINHPFGGTPIFGNSHIYKLYTYMYTYVSPTHTTHHNSY